MYIYKYEVRPVITLRLPINSTVLCVQMQHKTPQMWIMHADDVVATIERTFICVATGEHVEREMSKDEYIGTFQVDGLVFHVFEVMNNG